MAYTMGAAGKSVSICNKASTFEWKTDLSKDVNMFKGLLSRGFGENIPGLVGENKGGKINFISNGGCRYTPNENHSREIPRQKPEVRKFVREEPISLQSVKLRQCKRDKSHNRSAQERKYPDRESEKIPEINASGNNSLQEFQRKINVVQRHLPQKDPREGITVSKRDLKPFYDADDSLKKILKKKDSPALVLTQRVVQQGGGNQGKVMTNRGLSVNPTYAGPGFSNSPPEQALPFPIFSFIKLSLQSSPVKVEVAAT